MKENTKNRSETERRLLDAVTEVIGESGISGTGVNRVAEKAGCAKMLIYRYFGDFDGLMQRWAEENNYWIRQGSAENLERLAGLPMEKQLEAGTRMLRRQADEIRRSPVMRELLRWQLTEENGICSRMMEQAERNGLAITEVLSRQLEADADMNAVIALLTAGISYLALQADFAPVYNGVRLDSEQGWDRIVNAAGSIIRTAAGVNSEDNNENE